MSETAVTLADDEQRERELRAAFQAGVDWALWQEGYAGPDEPDEEAYVALVTESPPTQ